MLKTANLAHSLNDTKEDREKKGREERSRTDRVPNLEFDGLVVDGDHAGAEFDADGEVVHGLEALVRELQQQARLPHACNTNKQTTDGPINRRSYLPTPATTRHPGNRSPAAWIQSNLPRKGQGGGDQGSSGFGSEGATDLCRR